SLAPGRATPSRHAGATRVRCPLASLLSLLDHAIRSTPSTHEKDWRFFMRRTTHSWKRRAAQALAALGSLALLAPTPALAKTEIHFWHAMTGQLGDAVNELVKQFNDSQTEYEVKPLRKGTYPETLTAAIAAYRQKSAPHIVQVFEVGTQTMML